MEVMEVLIHIGFSESKHIGEERKLIYVLAGAYEQEHATALHFRLGVLHTYIHIHKLYFLSNFRVACNTINISS